MTALVVDFSRRLGRSLDWTNEELAQLYRIQHALSAAGVEFEIDRGVTDEGDPWFVFCRADGDVIVHIARFDGLYRLFSPGIGPLSGTSFPELTRSLLGAVPVPLQQGRDNRVVFHPAALLSILIVTIFYASDLVSSAEAHGRPTVGDLHAQLPQHDPSLGLLDASPLPAQERHLGEMTLVDGRPNLKVVVANHLQLALAPRQEAIALQSSTYLMLVSTVAAYAALQSALPEPDDATSVFPMALHELPPAPAPKFESSNAAESDIAFNLSSVNETALGDDSVVVAGGSSVPSLATVKFSFESAVIQAGVTPLVGVDSLVPLLGTESQQPMKLFVAEFTAGQSVVRDMSEHFVGTAPVSWSFEKPEDSSAPRATHDVRHEEPSRSSGMQSASAETGPRLPPTEAPEKSEFKEEPKVEAKVEAKVEVKEPKETVHQPTKAEIEAATAKRVEGLIDFVKNSKIVGTIDYDKSLLPAIDDGEKMWWEVHTLDEKRLSSLVSGNKYNIFDKDAYLTVANFLKYAGDAEFVVTTTSIVIFDQWADLVWRDLKMQTWGTDKFTVTIATSSDFFSLL